MSVDDKAEPMTFAADIERHQGEFHRYEATCVACGLKGTLRISVEPQRIGQLDAQLAAVAHPLDARTVAYIRSRVAAEHDLPWPGEIDTILDDAAALSGEPKEDGL
jgi:hypothetical protein